MKKSIAQTHKNLPMNIDGTLDLDAKKARAYGEKISAEYCFAEPFPHIIIDDFLPLKLIEKIFSEFPKDALQDDKFYEEGYSGLHKRQILPESCSVEARNFFHYMNSAPFLQFLEGLTTIDGLVGDPYFDGGGFHETAQGGKLGVHADFRINERVHLHRRINVLIYLNKDWNADWGGALELWDKKMQLKVKSVLPIFNRCVIFNTDADSYHGHPDPLTTPVGITRKSIALYYYTASKSLYEEVPLHSTKYVSRPGDSFSVKKSVVKSKILNAARDWLPPIVMRKLTNGYKN